METLMAEIRALGHLPREIPGLGDEYNLARRLRKAKTDGRLSAAQLAELAEIPRYHQSPARMDTLMAEVRALGHRPPVDKP